MQIDLKASISSKEMDQTSPSQKFPRLSRQRVFRLHIPAPGGGQPGGGSLNSEDLGPLSKPPQTQLLEAGLFASVSAAQYLVPRSIC